MAADDDSEFRLTVVRAALRLFAEQGYEATSVDQIAEAAGISRRTFFRQFRSKEDVVFADHETLHARTADYLRGQPHADPWMAVGDAAMLVYEWYTAEPDLARRRYEVVRAVGALHDREIVMVRRYETLFAEYLRARLPEAPGLELVQYAAAVVTTHNYLLGRTLRGKPGGAREVRAALADIRARRDADVVVAVFPRGTEAGALVRALENRLRTDTP